MTAAASRLTLVSGRVLIASSISSLGHGERIVPTEAELAAADRRDEARRAQRAQCRLDVHAKRAGSNAPSVFIESAAPTEHANVIRASYPLRFGAPERVQWLSTSHGLRPADAGRILAALGMRFARRRNADPYFVERPLYSRALLAMLQRSCARDG